MTAFLEEAVVLVVLGFPMAVEAGVEEEGRWSVTWVEEAEAEVGQRWVRRLEAEVGMAVKMLVMKSFH